LLERIDQPSDLKELQLEQLEQLAAEIRQFLIEKLSITGGHLAPNLGIVELTIVLHYLYNSPQDKFIFDVGHQAYVHKILTGRKQQFDQLRKYKGLCGFQKRAESIHDVWEAGHSSTSLSAAMGMAIARDLKKESFTVVPVIGDGAITGGMALEALNHIGHEKKKMMVVLNDNEMSIAPNVGAIHHYLSKIRTGRKFTKAKEELEQLIRKIPAIGGTLAKTAERVKDSMKYLLFSGVLFEELGFTYFGPIDGHNMPQMIEAFQLADKIDGPSLVHVITTKGKGYEPAERDSYTWHGISPYKIESGEVLKVVGQNPWYSDVFAKTLIELAETDERIVGVTAAMPSGTGLSKFASKFPERMYDVGIAEQHATTMCGALADLGMKPVFGVYSTFMQRAYDQIVHDVCRQNLNVVFAIDRAGLVGADGETHQGVYDIAYLRHIPNMVIMMPKDENELRNMIKTAIDYDGGPIAVRYPRRTVPGVQMDGTPTALPIGSWEVLQDGSDVAILALGPMVQIASQAVEQLKKENIHVRLINARFVKPLDEQMLSTLADEGVRIITCEEASEIGGLGSAVLEYYAKQKRFGMEVHVMGVPDYFVEHGSDKEQRQEVGLTVEQIINNVKSMLPRKRQRA
jgi:1-deoxy-D-xylulose-5-phosphate synthase